MLLSKFLDPKNDLAFKRVFGSERNKDILIHFLNDIFGRQTNPIEEVTFLKTMQEPEVASQRTSIVDILCEDTKGDRFIVEMQVTRERGFEKRAQYYAAKAYIEQRERGTDFHDLKEVTFLAISNFTLFPHKETYLSHHHILDIQSEERDLKDFSFSFLELPKFRKDKDQLKTLTEKWAYFFKHADETQEGDLERIIGSDKIILKAYEELNRFSWTREELRTYDSIDMKQASDRGVKAAAYEDGYEEGKNEGKAEGREEGKVEIAQAMIKEGISIDTIAKLTGFSEENLRDLSL